VDVRAQPAVVSLKLNVAGRTQIVGINAYQAKDFLRRWPEIEDISGSFDLAVALVKCDIETDSTQRQCRGHTARACTNHRDAALTPS
jgi:hypothetical protein